MRRLRRVVADVGREPGFGAATVATKRSRVRNEQGSEMTPEHPRAVAPRLKRFQATGFNPSPARSGNPRGSRLAVPVIEPPSDAMWPIVPLSVRLPELQRHYSPAALGSFRRPHQVGYADRQLLFAAR